MYTSPSLLIQRFFWPVTGRMRGREKEKEVEGE